MLVHVAQLSLASDEMEGHATLRWRAAGSALTPLSPLGEYEVRLDGADAKVHALLEHALGAAAARRQGIVAGRATASRSSPRRAFRRSTSAQLAPLLRLIAVENGKGIFELQLR